MRNLLHEMNPSVKFISVTLSMIAIAFFFNPWTPLLFFIGILFFQLFMSRINWRIWFLCMLPFALGAFGYLWTAVVFGAETEGTIAWSLFGLHVTAEQVENALSLTFRVLAFSALSLMFALTTDPVKFIMSLMQQLNLSPKLAYGVLVGYQFLPVMKDEFVQIQQAHRLRGAEVEKNAFQRLLGMRRILIPLLASAVRKAERSAFAMEARGFTGEPRTEYFRLIPLGKTDVLMGAIFAILLAGSCFIGFLLG